MGHYFALEYNIIFSAVEKTGKRPFVLGYSRKYPPPPDDIELGI